MLLTTEKVSSHSLSHFPTWLKWCFITTWQNRKQKSCFN